MSAAYFITGTDTDVGKTTIAAGLLHAAAPSRQKHRRRQTGGVRLRGHAQRACATPMPWRCWPSAHCR